MGDGGDEALELLASAVRLLVACRYPWEDIELIAAQAWSYLERVLRRLGSDAAPLLAQRDSVAEVRKMGRLERAHVLGVLMYLAHVYVEDERCPTKYWHERVFNRYCDMGTLHSAVLGLFGDYLGYILRVEEADLDR